MTRAAMHEGEVAVDTALVRRLLRAQAPQLAGLAIEPAATFGTVNAVFRLGDALSVRLPLLEDGVADLDREAAVQPRLAPLLPLAVPAVVRFGDPDDHYPYRWAICSWLPGSPLGPPADDHEDIARAEALAGFVAAMRAVDVTGAPRAGRPPLAELAADTRAALEASVELDRAAALAAWDRALEAPVWDGRATWIHADLLPGNLLATEGRLSGVIDWGAAGTGDPAHDLVPAWAVLGPAGRRAYRERLAPDDGTWARARGIALHQAAMAIPYYRDTNPGFAAVCRRTAEQVLLDPEA
ncbi:aminoglycoside phosphotransferase family protein [Amnibacterium sp. CER49]|uniref:aminoglycoside phosphotransferase family protein n=1 Tax=Amnibacterium sp. CER49 TaxID=3039161 RepID=UPI002447B131|nr:aminoglycoside phosphotransferase family protein [Amnibacterium sp. CER49]MDH2445468.1 aminoglycoside phosphotransferase family protein [Amnibacterium sp. CER49]